MKGAWYISATYPTLLAIQNCYSSTSFLIDDSDDYRMRQVRGPTGSPAGEHRHFTSMSSSEFRHSLEHEHGTLDMAWPRLSPRLTSAAYASRLSVVQVICVDTNARIPNTSHTDVPNVHAPSPDGMNLLSKLPKYSLDADCTLAMPSSGTEPLM